MSVPEVLQSLRLPIIGAPLFIASGPELVIAQCQAGIVGSFPALNARPVEELTRWLTRIETELAAFEAAHPDRLVAPFAVNQIVHASNDRLMHDVEVCVEHRVPLLISSLRAPERAMLDAIHSYGGLVFHDVISIRHAKKALDAGVDGLILVAAGAGGHAGMLSPFALVGEVRKFFDGPIALSGSIASGGAVLAAQAMGADFAYIGTRWLATQEANTSEGYREAIVGSAAADVVYTNLFTGVHGNYLKKSIEAAGLDPDALPQSDPKAMNFGSGGGSKAKAWRDIWGAGQGVGLMHDVPTVGEVVDRLEGEYRDARMRVAA
jgi:nitronate monooxygenase